MKTPMKTLGLIRIIGAAAATAAAVVTLAFAATVGQAARPPVTTWSPATNGTFDYGTVTVGQAASQTFALTNSGGSATGMLSVSLGGAAEFAITADACTGTALGPGKSCNVTVQFAPTTAGQSMATLAANGKKPPSSASITLTGTGSSAGTPNLVLSPGTFIGQGGDGSNLYDYHQFVSGVAQRFMVTNNGTGTSELLQIKNSSDPEYTVSNNECDGTSLAPMASCFFDVTFTFPANCTSGTPYNLMLEVDGIDTIYIELNGSETCP